MNNKEDTFDQLETDILIFNNKLNYQRAKMYVRVFCRLTEVHSRQEAAGLLDRNNDRLGRARFSTFPFNSLHKYTEIIRMIIEIP